MTDRNWEAELAKIDKQLASVSDEKLLADSKPVPAGKGAAPARGLVLLAVLAADVSSVSSEALSVGVAWPEPPLATSRARFRSSIL